jgi:hypothetical protein
MTDDELVSAIEATMRAAHLACQPYYLQLAHLRLPGVAVLRSTTLISSRPIGKNAQIDHLSIDLQGPPIGT